MNKKDRQKIILEVVNKNKVETQEELIELLREHGVNATQATISRDVRELAIVKYRDKNDGVYYSVIENNTVDSKLERLKSAVADYVVSVTQVQFMLVVKTSLGTADAVAAILDEGVFSDVVGTIAGTDTTVLICSNETAATEISDFISDFMED